MDLLTIISTVLIVWAILVIFIASFYQYFFMNKEEHEEDLEIKNENETVYKYKKYLNDYIVRVHDKTNIDDFHSLGKIVFVSEILNIVGIRCTEQVARLLREHPNVTSVSEDTGDGSLNLDRVEGLS